MTTLTKPEYQARVHNRARRNTVVDRTFLLDLARSIYDSKTRRFLRLCDGSLQNGPDPTDDERPMHCGLGELYYAMTGAHPKETGVDEDAVVNLAVELSPLEGQREHALAEARRGVEGLDLPEHLSKALLKTIEDVEDQDDEDHEDAESRFRAALDAIPDRNDDGCGDDSCSLADYRTRSKRVAAQLRLAADYLPKSKKTKKR